MRSTARFITTRKLLALASALTIGACSEDSNGLTPTDPKRFSSSAGGRDSSASGPASGTPAPGTSTPSDTAGSSPRGEWHLATIRGVVIGLDRNGGGVSGDTSSMSSNVVPGAKVEIHKISLAATGATGDSATLAKQQDLGIVATVVTDASGKFQYVLSDPIIVKSGQPSPTITYRLTITPPAGSPFAAQSGIQVFFMEQFPAGTADFNYFVFRPRT